MAGSMTTLYIRDVPAAVTASLKERAAAEGQSLSSYVGAQLAALAQRPTNEEIVARLRARARHDDVTAERIVDALHAGRR